MIVVRRPEDAEARLADAVMCCPRCGGALAKWGYARERTVRALGAATVNVRPRRVRCRDCATTHILLPTALQPRRADTTEVIGTALAHKANGLGFRRIAARMGRAESTVRRWLRRADRASALSFLRPCPVDSSRTRAASFAGTSMTSMRSARSRVVSGAPRPAAPSIAQPALGHWRAKRRSARYPSPLTGTRMVANGCNVPSTAAAVQDALCGSTAITTR